MVSNRLRERTRKWGQQQQVSRLIEADLIAVLNDDGVTSVKVTDSDTKNLVWAKLYGSDERIVQAYNTRVQPRNKCPVWIRRLADGTYEIEGGRSRDGTDLYQEAAGSVFLQELIGELLATVWSARNLKPGRARLSELGGMNLYIEDFFHASGWFAGDNIDLTAYIPAAGKHVWVKVWYDPSSDSLGATSGTEQPLPVILTELDLAAIVIPANYIPLAGVLLTDTDTTIPTFAGAIIAAQNWIDSPLGVNSLWPITITDVRSIPANAQVAVRRQTIGPGGVLTVTGVLDVF